MTELVFKGVLDVDVSDTVKKIEGSLPKIGRAAQKEMEDSINAGVNKTMKKMSKQWGNIASEYISGAFNPLLTAQEQRAMMAPRVARAGAMANPLGIALQKGAPELAKLMGDSVEAATKGAYMKANYVYSGTREAISGYAAQMGRLGLAPDQETLEYVARQEKERRERAFKAMQVATQAAQNVFAEEGVGEELLNYADAASAAISKIVQQFRDLFSPLNLFKKSVTEATGSLEDLKQITSRVPITGGLHE